MSQAHGVQGAYTEVGGRVMQEQLPSDPDFSHRFKETENE